jgi:hypothetical protein
MKENDRKGTKISGKAHKKYRKMLENARKCNVIENIKWN